jgi:N-formylglutamate amidohydrolase
MKQQLILHIPHASTHIPDTTGYVFTPGELQNEMLQLIDWYTDELFANSTDTVLIAPFSRVFCDVERFTDDAREPMALQGMGVLYEKSDTGKTMRRVTPQYRNKVIRLYYRPHHERLTHAVQNQLEKNGNCLIVDAHSFPDVPLRRDTDQTRPRPDFNIGTHALHTSPELARSAGQFFRERGFTVGINWPYAGTMVPMHWYNKQKKVQSLMLEVNRKLYLQPGSSEKSSNFKQLQQLVQEFLDTLRKQLS